MEPIQLRNPERVRALIQAGHLRSVSSDYALVDYVIEMAIDDLDTARELQERRPRRAYVIAYDAGHKALSAFLQAQGLRTSSTSGHHTLLLDVVADQAPGLIALISTMRTATLVRNSLYYPTGPVEPPTAAEVDALLDHVTKLVTGVKRLVDDRAIPLFR